MAVKYILLLWRKNKNYKCLKANCSENIWN